MKLFLIFLGISVTCLIHSCSAIKKQPSVYLPSDFDKIGQFLQSLVDTGNIPGIAIAITSGKHIIYSNAFGVASTKTWVKLQSQHIFHIASVSKTFTASAVMQLAEKNKININEPLTRYLPYFKMNDQRYAGITIQQMLNHTSGMPDVEDYEWEKAIADEGAAERFTRSLATHKLVSDPGKEYHYSNIAFDLMADLVFKVSGIPFEQYVKENILIPLEMLESSFYYPEIKLALRTSPHTGNPPLVSPVYPYNRQHAPSSTLNTNVIELANWAIVNLHEGEFNGKQIISRRTHSIMTTPTVTVNKANKISMGLSWFIYTYREMKTLEHGGSDLGYESLLTLIPEKKLGIIILSNCEEIRMYDARNRIRDILLTE